MKLDLTDTSIYDDGLNRFEDKEIDFSKSINIIYGKNGTGKSSICKLMKEQWKDKEVCIFRGFNELLDENEKLNAIVLGEDNSKINKEATSLKKEIDEIEKEREEKKENIEKPKEGSDRKNLFTEKEELEKQKRKNETREDNIYTDGASKVKKKGNLSLFDGKKYDKNNFRNDLEKAKEQGKLSEDDIKVSRNTIIVSEKDNIDEISLNFIDLNKEQKEINSLLEKTVKPVEVILELEGNHRKQDFAKVGLECHKPNDKCAFCGNVITEERYKKVKRYFSSDDIKAFENEIQDKLEFIKGNIGLENKNINIDKEQFYPKFKKEIEYLKKEIATISQGRKNILNRFKSSLEEKKGKLFEKMDILNEEMSEDLEEKINKYNEIVKENNQYTKDLERNKEEARKKYRYHEINVFLKEKDKKNKNYENYGEELESIKGNIQELEGKISAKDDEIEKIKDKIDELEKNIEYKKKKMEDFLANTKNTEILANNINKKIKGTVNFRLCRKEENGQEFYEIKEKIDGREETIRSITKLSDGEKNIIAFLYFIEKLKDPDKKDQEKIIVFDDPMNSNDDTMQYLITSEIENIVKSIYPNKKDKNIEIKSKDKLILLTHNAHFYFNNLNNLSRLLRYVGKGVYKECNIYRFISIKGKTIIAKIENINKDIKNSYQMLWLEVGFLYEKEKPDLMLNPIRRIIESFCSFNVKNKDDFYEKSEGLKKLLDVNSHGIEDLEADLNGKDQEQIKDLLFEIFECNGYKEHFDQLWEMYSSANNKEKVG